MKKLILLFGLFMMGGLVYGLWSYQLVTSEDGSYLRKKQEGGFSDLVVKEKGVERLGRKLSENLEDFGQSISREWGKLSQKMDSLVDKSDLEKGSDDFREAVADLNKDVQKRYDKLAKKWKDGDYNLDTFNEKLAELEEWATKQMEKIKSRFSK